MVKFWRLQVNLPKFPSFKILHYTVALVLHKLLMGAAMSSYNGPEYILIACQQ